MRISVLLLLLGGALAAPLLADEKTREERLLEAKIEDLNELSERLNRYSVDSVETPEREQIHELVQALMQRARKEPPGYVYERWEDAIDDLLDGSDEIGDAYSEEPDEDDTQERAARELERTYFDLQQGRYFAEQVGMAEADQLVELGKRLYQKAREEYDAGRWARSRDLAEAAREMVETLESLAHAAVRIPEPPRL